MDEPAGYHNSEQDPETPKVAHGAAFAHAKGMLGNRKPLDARPGRLNSDATTAKIRISLTWKDLVPITA